MKNEKNEIIFNAVDFEPVRKIAMNFSHTSDSLSHYDTPSVKIKKSLLCRLNENGQWFVIRTDFESRERFLEQYPESCFITPHYQDYAYLCLDVNNYTTTLVTEILQSGYDAIMTHKKSKQNP